MAKPADAAITMGQAPNGELVHIESQTSGRTDLVCPFCHTPLLAARGKQLIHHFRHDGPIPQDCQAYQAAIPGWDHFTLSLQGDVLQALQAQTHREFIPLLDHGWPWTKHERVLTKLERLGLLQRGYQQRLELTDTAMVVPGLLTFSAFDEWLRPRLAQRLVERRARVEQGEIQGMHLVLEQARQQRLLSSTLYLFELRTAAGEVIHKIGRTGRAPVQRLAEVIADLQRVYGCPVTGTVLREIPQAGYLEQYALWRYRRAAVAIHTHREYLVLDASRLRQFKAELTRFERTRAPLSDEEWRLAAGGAVMRATSVVVSE